MSTGQFAAPRRHAGDARPFNKDVCQLDFRGRMVFSQGPAKSTIMLVDRRSKLVNRTLRPTIAELIAALPDADIGSEHRSSFEQRCCGTSLRGIPTGLADLARPHRCLSRLAWDTWAIGLAAAFKVPTHTRGPNSNECRFGTPDVGVHVVPAWRDHEDRPNARADFKADFRRMWRLHQSIEHRTRCSSRVQAPILPFEMPSSQFSRLGARRVGRRARITTL